jgi:hypothetical protein
LYQLGILAALCVFGLLTDNALAEITCDRLGEFALDQSKEERIKDADKVARALFKGKNPEASEAYADILDDLANDGDPYASYATVYVKKEKVAKSPLIGSNYQAAAWDICHIVGPKNGKVEPVMTLGEIAGLAKGPTKQFIAEARKVETGEQASVILNPTYGIVTIHTVRNNSIAINAKTENSFIASLSKQKKFKLVACSNKAVKEACLKVMKE